MREKPSKKRFTMDGFVARERKPVRRLTLDNSNKRGRVRHTIDGFVPRNTESDKPLQFKKEVPVKDSWSDENTLNISNDDIGEGEAPRKRKLFKKTVTGREKRPAFWKLRQRRAWRKRNPLSPRAKVAKRIVTLILVVAILWGGFLGFKALRALSNVFQGSILNVLSTTKLKGEDKGRVNILLTGTSEDDPGHDGADLTDSIMILSLDTINKTGFMMSVPRDLWVTYGESCMAGNRGKINAAYECGQSTNFEESGYAKGGMGLLEKIIEQNFGIEINYYVKINYTAFKQAVDTVGGVDINIKTDDPRGILDRNFDWQCKYQCFKVKYPNGPQHLNGEQALNLARARGVVPPTYGAGNDYGRTERQRQMLMSLKSKALSAGILTNPAKISSLLDTAGENVTTDFQTNELIRLYNLGKDVDNSKIKSIGLTDEGVELVTGDMISGQSVVVPTAGVNNFSQIKLFIRKAISSDPLLKEGANVIVLNGSGISGLAQKRADELESKGVAVGGVGNGTAQKTSLIIDKTSGKKPSTKKLLEQQFRATATTNISTVPEAGAYPNADFIVIIGANVSSSQVE